MALTLDRSEAWQENTSVEIRDIQTHDISADLLDVRDVPEKYRAQALQNMEHVLSVARDTPNYHWLCGYVDGHKVANVYCLRHGDVMEMDDLWVDENFRGRYIATTLMKYIAQNFGGTLYLHAAANETPKDMYRKMGFETVETIYDYYLTF